MKWQDKRPTGEPERKRPAKTGKFPFSLIECIVLLLIIAVLIMLVMPMNLHVPDDGPQWLSSTHLFEIGLAMHEYVHDHKTLPPAVVYDPHGKPLYSWRVLLLPYLESVR